MRPQPRYRPGDKIGGRCEVHQVKMGGMGEVYLCLDLATNLPYALKTFQQRYLTNPKILQTFKNEVATWIALEKHPHLVRCHYMDILDNQPFIFLEWIVGEDGRGDDLRGWLRFGPLDLRLVLEFTMDICRGLIHAQEKQPGIVHRDLKPENVLIAQGRVAKITDFGLAQIVQTSELKVQPTATNEPGERQNLLGQGGLIGTPAYMAPEQWRGEPLDVRADIYAVGCILYELLTGHRLFQAATLDGLRGQHLEADAAKLVEKENWSNGLDQLLVQCLVKQPEKRLANVEELLQKLGFIFQQYFAELPRRITSEGEFTPMDYNNRGLTYSHLNNPEAALADFNQTLQLNPNYMVAYFNRGIIYRNLHQYEAALTNFTQAIQLDPNFALAYSNRGITYANLQQYQAALADCNRAIQLDPNSATAYSSRADTYLDMEQYEAALADFDRVIQLNPHVAKAYFNRGTLYHKLGQYAEALTDYNQSIQLDPTDAKTYFNRGSTYRELHQYVLALTEYSQAIQVDPVLISAYMNRGATYRDLQQYEAALADYNQVIQLDPNSVTAYSNRGLIYHDLRQYKLALIDFNQAIQLDSSSAEIYHNRSLTYTALQQYELALADCNQAIGLKPNNAEVYSTRGLTYNHLGQYEAALTDYNRAIELDPNSAAAYSNRGTTYLDLHQYQAALVDYNLAIHLSPNDAMFYFNRGTIYYHLQQYKLALVDFSLALQLAPDLAPVYTNRGSVYAALEQYEAALTDYIQALQLNPIDATACLNLGILLSNKGFLNISLPYYEKAASLGEIRGKQYAAHIRHLLEFEVKPPTDPFQRAFNALQEAGSFEDVQQAVLKFPFMTENSFIIAIEQAISQQIPPTYQPPFQQRLAWLRQIAAQRSNLERK